MSGYINKKGKASYSVMADTHGYVTGRLEGDFDLGDNTNTYPNPVSYEPITAPHARKLAILGNHDIAQLLVESGLEIEKDDETPVSMPDTKEWRGLQEFADYKNKIWVFGVDSAKTFHYYVIPVRQIEKMAERLLELEEDFDVIFLSHVPLYPKHEGAGSCFKRWDRIDESLRNAEDEDESNMFKSPRDVVRILSAFKRRGSVEYNGRMYDYSDKTSNHVIGCFAGHVHKGVKCAVALSDYAGEEGGSNEKIYMEAFTTNGSNESTDRNEHNPGMYIPDPASIDIDFDKMTVNGVSYVDPDIGFIVSNISHGKPLCDKATGEYSFSKDSNLIPKFYKNRFIGWNVGANKLMIYGSAIFPTDGVFVKGLEKHVDALRFSASGRLKYYIEKGDTEIREIPSYDRIRLEFTTTGSVHWTFEDGLFKEYKKI